MPQPAPKAHTPKIIHQIQLIHIIDGNGGSSSIIYFDNLIDKKTAYGHKWTNAQRSPNQAISTQLDISYVQICSPMKFSAIDKKIRRQAKRGLQKGKQCAIRWSICRCTGACLHMCVIKKKVPLIMREFKPQPQPKAPIPFKIRGFNMSIIDAILRGALHGIIEPIFACLP